MKHLRIIVILVVAAAFSSIIFIPPIAAALDPYNIKEPGPPIITKEGVLFRYKSEGKLPKYVQVNGEFNHWEEPLLMSRNRNDVYVYFYTKKRNRSMVLDEGRYTYRYLIDGIWTKDPYNKNVISDKLGTELSYFDVPVPIIVPERNPVYLSHNDYIFYYINPRAKQVSIVGDFNNWNPYSHPLSKNKSGLWEVTVDLPPGNYNYRFIVDGVFKTDPLAKNLVKNRLNTEYSSITMPIK